MPMAAAAISAAFSYVSAAAASAAYTAATAIGISSAAAGTIGAAVSSSIMWVGTANGFGTLMAVGSVVSSLSQKVPKPTAAGVQLDTKLSPTPPRTVCIGRTALAGTMLYQAVSGVKKPNDNIRLHRIIGLSVGPIDAVESFHIGDKELTFSNPGLYGLGEVVGVSDTEPDSKLWRTNYRQGYSLGQTPEPSAPPVYTGTAMPGLSETSKLSGIAHVTQALDFHGENFSTGDPKNGGYRFIVRGVKLYDPRKDSTYPGGLGSHRLNDPATYEFSDNPVIAALNFALGHYQNGKLVWGMGAPWETIDVPAFVAAANVADVNGWKVGGEFNTVDDKFSVLTAILQAASARPVNNSGHLSVFIDTPLASVMTLTKADVCGNVELSTSTAWRDRRNRVIPFYRAESQGWEMVGGDPIAPSTYLAEDGEQKTLEVSFPYVQDASQAHQIGAYELANTREFLNFTVTCTPRLAMAARPGDCITVDLPDIGASNQKCVVLAADIDPASWQITLTLRSESDKHAFALGQTAEPPSSPGLSGSYDPSNPYTPTDADGFPAWTIVANSVSKDGVTLPGIVVAGGVYDDNDREIIVDYREFGSDEDAWTNWTTASRNTTRFEIAPLKSAQAYHISIQHRNGFGALSKRLILGPHTTANLSIDAGKIDFLSQIGEASLAAWAENVNETVEAAAEAAAQAATVIDDVNLLSETSIEQSLRDVYLKDYVEELAYLEGQPIATVISEEKTQRIEGDTALAETIGMIGAKSADNLSFIIDTDKVRVSPTETLAERFSAMVVEAGEDADAKILEERSVWSDAISAQASATTLLSARVGDAEAAITTESEARVEGDTSLAQTLSLLGAENEAGTAFVLDNSKVEISPGQSLASRLTSLQSSSDTNAASITSLSTTVTNNQTSTASSISTLTATTNGHTSSISLLNSASSSYGTKTVLSTNVNGHVAGTALLNGGAGASSFIVVADKFVVASTSGGVAQAPFAVSGSTVYMDNVVARNIGAGTITTDKIVANNLTQTTILMSTSSQTLSSSEQTICSGSVSVQGKVELHIFANFNQTSGSPAGAGINIYRNGSLIAQYGQYCAGAWGSNYGTWVVPDQPGDGTHTYTVNAYTTGGSSGNPTKTICRIQANVKKTEV